jgi:hypothetical protein
MIHLPILWSLHYRKSGKLHLPEGKTIFGDDIIA